MPINFPKLEPGETPKLQEVFLGSPLERAAAVSDVVMNYPRIVNLPVNYQWNPYLQAGEKK